MMIVRMGDAMTAQIVFVDTPSAPYSPIVIVPDGTVVRCAGHVEAGLFAATSGPRLQDVYLMQVIENPGHLSAEEIKTRAFWIRVVTTYKHATLEEKLNLFDAISQWTTAYYQSGIYGERASPAFRLLHCLIDANHPNVQFADTLTPVLANSLHFAWTQPLDNADDIQFITSLIAQSRREHVSIEFTVSKALIALVQTLSDSDNHVWKRLLLLARLVDALDPINPQQSLPSWSDRVARFVLDCLQVKRIMQSASCRFVIYEVLAALSRYVHNSLRWLRPLCVPTNTGQPLAILLTSAAVEIQLELDKMPKPHSLDMSISDATNTRVVIRSQSGTEQQEQQLDFVPSVRVRDHSILINASDLLRLGLADMKEANSSVSVYVCMCASVSRSLFCPLSFIE
ncbi:unnamed protein product [Echinostoma caproni]|uniref:MOR2-PAG1_mid domain-containing protein n=1 Tax=Echinostoma caproni TaxID=27848 RepID=A0A183B1C7_9TREM|nr:unnamed protein product [Echinostoma caproni]